VKHSMNLFILVDGVPTVEPDTLKWGEWMEGADRTVAKEEVIPDVEVSTVFLGHDLGFWESHPILYETMVFGGQHDGYQQRYETREQALRGHDQVKVMVRT